MHSCPYIENQIIAQTIKGINEYKDAENLKIYLRCTTLKNKILSLESQLLDHYFLLEQKNGIELLYNFTHKF